MTESKDLAQRVEELEAELEAVQSKNFDLRTRLEAVQSKNFDVRTRNATLARMMRDYYGPPKSPNEQGPVFWYRPCGDDGVMHEGPLHDKSSYGQARRKEQPGQWVPLYARPIPADPVNARLLDTLKKCRDQFQRYVEHHLDKGDYDKAAANQSFAWLAGAAISEAENQPPEAGDCTKGERE